MEKKRLLNTDLEVSPICLGTVNYGTVLDDAYSKRQLSEFLEAGGNFVDTAKIYGSWVEGKDSPSEKVIGDWFKETGNRDKIVLATKGAHPDWDFMDVPRVHAKDIGYDLDCSLDFLKTDYIDLYFLHRDDPKVPVEEIVDCLDAAVDAGKIRYYGCSNWHLSRIKEAAEYARSKGSKGFVVNQLMLSLADINFYNLADKSFVLLDQETDEYQAQAGMNAMAYMSIAKAFFTRKAGGENLPPSVSDVYENDTNTQIYNKILSFVKNNPDYSIIDLSLMYIMHRNKYPTIPIASFDNSAQLKSGLACWNKPMPVELMNEFDSIKKYVYWK